MTNLLTLETEPHGTIRLERNDVEGDDGSYSLWVGGESVYNSADGYVGAAKKLFARFKRSLTCGTEKISGVHDAAISLSRDVVQCFYGRDIPAKVAETLVQSYHAYALTKGNRRVPSLDEFINELLDAYFALGRAEGREDRVFDNKTGDAQAIRSALNASMRLAVGSAVSWRCKGFSDGWIYFTDEVSAKRYASDTGCILEPLGHVVASVPKDHDGTPFELLPVDLVSHLHDFRNAAVIAAENAETDDDCSYWQKQIVTIDRAESQIAHARGWPPPFTTPMPERKPPVEVAAYDGKPVAYTQRSQLSLVADNGLGQMWGKRDLTQVRDIVPDCPDDIPLFTAAQAYAQAAYPGHDRLEALQKAFGPNVVIINGAVSFTLSFATPLERQNALVAFANAVKLNAPSLPSDDAPAAPRYPLTWRMGYGGSYYGHDARIGLSCFVIKMREAKFQASINGQIRNFSSLFAAKAACQQAHDEATQIDRMEAGE